MPFFTRKQKSKREPVPKPASLVGGQPRPPVTLSVLGGTTDVTKNMFVYECGEDIIIVDCGIGFPHSDMPGVDLLLPDISHLLDKKNRLKAILITHGHEDHFGALPYLIDDLGKPPIYATKLVAGFIKNRLIDFNVLEGTRINIIDPEKDVLNIGNFVITPFRVGHSVPDSVGFFIETPQGNIAHVSDFKFDWTPVDNRPFDAAKITRLAERGIDLLLSDCLGANAEGFTHSEQDIEKGFLSLLDQAKKQVFISTISSNISRIQQAINASLKYNRRIVALGRSISQNIETAQRLGYLDIPKGARVSEEAVMKQPQEKLTYIVAGAYGQEGSALSRLANNDHKFVKIQNDALVIFSGDPAPPGVRDNVDLVIDRLTALGAGVHYYEIQENLYVSGHGSSSDLTLLAQLTKPKYLVPIGGTRRHMRAYSNLMERTGVDPNRQVFELLEGQSLILENGKAWRGKNITAGNIFVDGTIGDIGSVVIRDRKILADDGIFVVIVPVSMKKRKIVGKIEIASRGFVYVKESRELLDQAADIAKNIFYQNKKAGDWGSLKRRVEDRLQKFLYKETGRRPLILTVVIEVP